MTLIDISPAVSTTYPVWPGDAPVSQEMVYSFSKGDNANVSTLRSTVHLGAHADAPSHYAKEGKSIGERSLDYYLGLCQVIRVSVSPKHKITPKDLLEDIQAPRVLIATHFQQSIDSFEKDFPAFSEELMDYFHAKKVITVGIDTPSIDLYTDCGILAAHKLAHKYDMAVLECLDLKVVEPGLYELIALPLKLMGFDASPVRAILRKN